MTCAIALLRFRSSVDETTSLIRQSSKGATAPPGVCAFGPVSGRRACVLAPVGRDLGDELLEDGVAEGLVILRGDHEGAGAADDAVVVIAVEVGLEREDRQA